MDEQFKPCTNSYGGCLTPETCTEKKWCSAATTTGVPFHQAATQFPVLVATTNAGNPLYPALLEITAEYDAVLQLYIKGSALESGMETVRRANDALDKWVSK